MKQATTMKYAVAVSGIKASGCLTSAVLPSRFDSESAAAAYGHGFVKRYSSIRFTRVAVEKLCVPFQLGQSWSVDLDYRPIELLHTGELFTLG